MDPLVKKRIYELQPRLSGQLQKLADYILRTDLLFVVGFQKIARKVQSVVRNAKERRATVLLLTSTAANPVADKADMVILVDRGNAESLQSVTAGFSLGHALVIAVASQLGTRSLAFLNAIDVMERKAQVPKSAADN